MSEFEELVRAFERIHGLGSGDLVVQDEVLETRVEGSSPDIAQGEGRLPTVGWGRGESSSQVQEEWLLGEQARGHLPAFTSSRLGGIQGSEMDSVAVAAASHGHRQVPGGPERRVRSDRIVEELVSRYEPDFVPYHGGPGRGALLAMEIVGGPMPREIKKESHTNLGVGTQWRSTEGKEELMVEVLERLVSRLDKMGGSTSGDPELEFSGRPSEDPGSFMWRLEGWLTENQVPEARWRTVMRRCLKGSAYSWYEGVQDQDWEVIKALFEQRWNSVAVRGRLWRQLFGETQKPNEAIAAFIMGKWGLFRRLAPEMPEGEKLDIIKELLLPEVRAYIRGSRIESMRDLLELGGKWRGISKTSDALSGKENWVEERRSRDGEWRAPHRRRRREGPRRSPRGGNLTRAAGVGAGVISTTAARPGTS